MKYWFIFCKTDLLLEKKEDGTYTIPCSESPIPTKPWTHILNITRWKTEQGEDLHHS